MTNFNYIDATTSKIGPNVLDRGAFVRKFDRLCVSSVWWGEMECKRVLFWRSRSPMDTALPS